MDPDPLRGLVAGTAPKHRMDRRRPRDPVRRPARCRRRPRRRPRPRPGSLGSRSRTIPAIAAECLGGLAVGGQREAHVEERERLAFPLDRGSGAVTLPPRELADDDPDEEQQQEVEPFARVANGEGVPRLDEQEVVGEEGPDGGRDRRPRPGDDGDGDDREQVGRRGVADAGCLERGDDDAFRRSTRRRSPGWTDSGSTWTAPGQAPGGSVPRTMRRARRATRTNSVK